MPIGVKPTAQSAARTATRPVNRFYIVNGPKLTLESSRHPAAEPQSRKPLTRRRGAAERQAWWVRRINSVEVRFPYENEATERWGVLSPTRLRAFPLTLSVFGSSRSTSTEFLRLRRGPVVRSPVVPWSEAKPPWARLRYSFLTSSAEARTRPMSSPGAMTSTCAPQPSAQRSISSRLSTRSVSSRPPAPRSFSTCDRCQTHSRRLSTTGLRRHRSNSQVMLTARHHGR